MTISEIFGRIYKILDFTLFKIGDTSIGLGALVTFIVILVATVAFSRFISKLLATKVLSRMPIEEGKQYVLKRITEYTLIIIGAIVAFETIGIDLSGLAVIFGLLSVGIGFGLQNITSNFISGLILLFERPIEVGDRVTVGNIEGDVEEINIRSTTIRSLNNISIIVPNSEFVTSKVINWSHGDRKVRLDLNIGVSYDSDLDTVLQSLKEVALENEHVLKRPTPEVIFMEFANSSWNLQLRAWIADPKRHFQIRHALNCAIVNKFRANKIEIPYPQQDLHLRSSIPLTVKNK